MPRGPPGHRKQEKASWVRELIYVTDGGATRKTGPAKCNRQRSRWIQMRVLISTQGFFLWNRQDSQQARGVLRTTVLATWRAPYQCLYRHSLVNGPQWRILRFELQSDVRKRPSKTPLNVATTPRAGYKRKKSPLQCLGLVGWWLIGSMPVPGVMQVSGGSGVGYTHIERKRDCSHLGSHRRGWSREISYQRLRSLSTALTRSSSDQEAVHGFCFLPTDNASISITKCGQSPRAVLALEAHHARSIA